MALTGPRQAGKSPLAKYLFKDKPYCSFEDLDQREFAREDPSRFLASYPNGAIFDEVQHVPTLFSYLQTRLDEEKKMGSFILTGSQQFSLQAKISQPLAGRMCFVQLLSFYLLKIKASHTGVCSVCSSTFLLNLPQT